MKTCIVFLLILTSINAQCASWADIAKGNARKPVAPVAQPKTTPSVEIHKPQPASEPVMQQPTLPEHALLIQQAHNALATNKKASIIEQTLVPILSMNVHPYIKSLACNMNAAAHAKEKNTRAELISLCNELGVSYNENMLISYNDQQLFPSYNLIAVHRLCELFATGFLSEFKNICQDDELAQKFQTLIMHTGYVTGSIHATHLLAQSAEETGDYARAVELYAILPAEYAQPLQTNITVAKLLHAQTDNAALPALFETIAIDITLQAPVLAALSEKQHPNIVQSFWQHIYKTRQGNEKVTAAFELSKILRNSNVQMADIYLSIAASAGKSDACKYAFNLGSNEVDEAKSIKYYEAAALGDHLGALVKCGSYYKNLSTEKATDAKESENHLKKARMYLEKAAAKNSPAARLELAIMPSTSRVMVAALKKLIKEPKFPLKSEAQHYLGKIFLKIGLLYDKKNSNTGKRNKYLKKAETMFKLSAQAGFRNAKISYPLCLIQLVNYTSQQKRRNELYAQAEALLTAETNSQDTRQDALAGLGQLYLAKNQLTCSVEHFIEAYRCNPKDEQTMEAILNAIEALRDQDNFSHIRNLATAMLEINPSCPYAHLNLGVLALHLEKDMAAARTYFERAGELGSPAGFKNLGTTYFETATCRDDYAQALTYFERALQLSPRDSDLMNSLGHTYHALGRYNDAKASFLKGTAYENAESFAALANYWHKGFTGARDLICAQKLYELASTKYAQLGNVERSSFCAKMNYVLAQQSTYNLSDSPNEATFITNFRTTVNELTTIANTPNQYPAVVNEARYALATQYAHCTAQYKDTAKKKNTYLLALKTIDLMPDQTHKEAQTTKAEIIRQLIIQNLLDRTIPAENELAETFCPLYEDLIEKLERERPLSQMLLDACNSYGLYHMRFAANSEKALVYFHKAAERDSAEAILHLYTFCLRENNLEAGRIWLEKAYALDPKSPFVLKFMEQSKNRNEPVSANTAPQPCSSQEN